MSSKHNLHVGASVPLHISPEEVIAALHDHQTALTLQALTTSNAKALSTDPATLKDTYWYPPDTYPITTYNVTECVTIIPGMGELGKKYLTFPSCFQNTRQGIKTRADASGVIVRAEFRVVRGGAAAEIEGEGMGIGDAEWVLIEDVEVSCSRFVMPFVKGKMEEAHRDICSKIIEKVEMQRRQTALAHESPHAKIRADEGRQTQSLAGFAQQPPQRALFGQDRISSGHLGRADSVESRRFETTKPLPETPLPEKIIYG